MRVGGALFAAAAIVAAVGAFAVAALIGQRLAAPQWLHDRIEARVEASLGDLNFDFGDVSLVVNKGWRPRLRLRDVVLSDAGGQELIRLNHAEAALAMRPLLKGRIQPKNIALSGALAMLRRDADGDFVLALGPSLAPVDSAEGLPQLIDSWDSLFLMPQLAALTRVEMDALTLRYEDARQGRAWTLDGGTVQLDREGDELWLSAGFSLLSGRDYAGVVEANYKSRIGETTAEFGILVQDIAAQDIAGQSVAFGWLEVLRAPISGALRGGVDGKGTLAPLSATLQIGAGVLQPTDGTRPIPFQGARSYFTYDPSAQVLRFNELSVESDWVSGIAEGSAYLGGVDTGVLTDMEGQFDFSNMRVNPDGLYPEPLEFATATADFRLELDPFRLTVGQMLISDPEATALLAGTLDGGDAGWKLALDAQMDQLTPRHLARLWPAGAAPKPREWVTSNLTGGRMQGLSLSMRSEPGQPARVYAGFDFRDMEIRYHKLLPPIAGAAGQVSLADGRLVATTTAGAVTPPQGGTIGVAGSSFIIPDMRIKKAAPGIARIRAEGSATAFLSLLNQPPMQVLRKSAIPVDAAEGMARVRGTLALPLKDRVLFEELEFHFDGTIRNVSTDKLMPGHVLQSPAIRVSGDQSHIRLAGKGTLDGVPTEAVWQRQIGKGVGDDSRVEGRIELSPLLLDRFAVGLPEGSVGGRGYGSFTVDLRPGAAPLLELTSDLRGLTLSLPPLGWSKPASRDGLLRLEARLGDTPTVDRLELVAAGLNAVGSVVVRPEGGLGRALFSAVKLSPWLDVSAELVGRGEDAPPDLNILGGTLDLRTATFGGAGDGAGQTGSIQATLDRLQVTDSYFLTGFSGGFTTGAGLSGTFAGKLNGQAPVTGTVLPQAGRSAFLIEADDAGGVFRSAGILQQGRGGDFRMSLQPAGEPGRYEGNLRVEDTRVIDAPAMAALLNAISVVGLIDEMAGQGILFTEVEARFRLEPGKVTLFQSSAVGPSIGLSMDGTYDVASGFLNMRGVITPVYLLNAIGSVLTRKGEGLIGFSYTLTGPGASPSVVVNPLSGLAPGMLREVFRGAPPTDSDAAASPGEPEKSWSSPDAPEGSTGGR